MLERIDGNFLLKFFIKMDARKTQNFSSGMDGVVLAHRLMRSMGAVTSLTSVCDRRRKAISKRWSLVA
jgi:hypothetical protein